MKRIFLVQNFQVFAVSQFLISSTERDVDTAIPVAFENSRRIVDNFPVNTRRVEGLGVNTRSG